MFGNINPLANLAPRITKRPSTRRSLACRCVSAAFIALVFDHWPPTRRSSSPFRGKGSPFVPSSNSGISFVRLISTSRVIAAPVPRYGSICDGEHDEHTFNSNKYFVVKFQPVQLLGRIHEDLEPETSNEDDALVHACRTNVTTHLVLRRVERTTQGTQEDEADFLLPNEIEYMRTIKRVRIDELPCELSDGRLDVSSHSGSEHTRLQLDLDNDTSLDLHLPRSDLVRVPQRKSLLMGCSQMWRLSWPRSEVAYLLERRVASRL
jgi:hypothetical protein